MFIHHESMKNKRKRQGIIRKLILSKDIYNQEHLNTELKELGIKATQATISRDLKDLKTARIMTNSGKYKYYFPNSSDEHVGLNEKMFSSLVYVIRTKPGSASSLAVSIDTKEIPGVVGTVAGDDTVFVALNGSVDKGIIVSSINELVEAKV